MVSVVFAIWPLPSTPNRLAQDRAGGKSRPPVARASGHSSSKRRASLAGHPVRFGSDIAWPYGARAKRNDVNDVSGLPEPHGPDGTMADGGFRRAEIPQPRPAGRLRQAVWAAFGGARTDLALLAHLYAAGLRHRQHAGRQPEIGDHGR